MEAITKNGNAIEKKLRSFDKGKLLNMLTDLGDPLNPLKALHTSIEDWKNSKNKEETIEHVYVKIAEAQSIVSLDTHHSLARSLLKELRPLAIEFSNQLIVEYDCKTASEKALAEIAVAAYIRILQFTEIMTRQARNEQCSPTLNEFYKSASQELDRANRHFLTAITTLKQMKSPVITVQVKATTAFIAQNQQINAIARDETKR